MRREEKWRVKRKSEKQSRIDLSIVTREKRRGKESRVEKRKEEKMRTREKVKNEERGQR